MPPEMTEREIEDLFDANMLVIDELDIEAGSMIKAVILGIEKNGPAYIRLKDPVVGGRKVSFEHVQGDETLVGRVGRSLGLICAPGTLEVRSSDS